MRSSIHRLGAWLLCAAALSLTFNTAFAHGPGGYESSLDEPSGGGGGNASGMFMGEELARSLGAIQALMEKNQYQEAVQRLEALDARSDGYNKYENAILHQNLGYAYASVNDYPKAAEAFEECLSFKALPKEMTLAVMQNLGQLYVATEQYDKGIAVLEAWIGQSGGKDVSPHLRVLLGDAYLNKKDYAKAAAQFKQAIAGVERPEKSWIQLLAASYQQWGHYSETAEALQQGVAFYPDEKPFWQQLAMTYRQMHDDGKAAAALALSCNAGLCDTKDITYLARLYLYLGAPTKAADLLDTALQDGRMKGDGDDWQLLAQSWQQARELDKAEQAYKEAARRNASSGEPDFRLGQIYVQQGKWQAAADTLSAALKKGGLPSPGRAQLMLGVSYYYLGHTQQAMAAVEAATRHSDVEKEAQRWLKQLREAPVPDKAAKAKAEGGTSGG
jgi:tetratricopeptide (TPR) repeat protein